MSGRSLAQRYYEQIVRPILDGTPHSAALLGDGSEVLGLDDDVSTDHDFGPRVQLFLAPEIDRAPLDAALRSLPEHFEGFPVGHRCADQDGGWMNDAVMVTSAEAFFAERLGTDPADGMTLEDWLTTPTQRLATLVDGVVFHDPDGMLAARRTVLQWYPQDVWRYVLASAWLRVSQEEAFIGRAGSVNDDLGSALVASRVARDLVKLAFLIERRWAPYSKWLGTAFSRLTLAPIVGPYLYEALQAASWREREAALCAAQRELAVATNRLRLAEEVDPEPRQFYDRDIRVLGGDRFTAALANAIVDPEVTALIERLGRRQHEPVLALPGAIDQAVDSVDILTSPDRCRSAASLLGLK
jgi:catechol 2,3-dioxygenase-like lactoylglutathione lyase family enzyme